MWVRRAATWALIILLLCLTVSPAAAQSQDIYVTTFTQSLGSELVVDGGFEIGSPPTYWYGGGGTISRVSDPRPGSVGAYSVELSRVDNNNPYVHPVSNITTTIGRWYEMTGWYKNISFNGGAFLRQTFAPQITSPNVTGSTWVTFANVSRRLGSTAAVRGQGGSNANGQTGRYDDLSFRAITPNQQQTVPSADRIITFQFTLPVSPAPGDSVHLIYRIPDGYTIESASASYWDAYVKRNDTNTAWDFYLDSVSADTATNRTSATNVGTPNAIRVAMRETIHNAYTGVGGVFTRRGSQVNVDFLTTSRGVNTIYDSDVTPSLLYSEPVSAAQIFLDFGGLPSPTPIATGTPQPTLSSELPKSEVYSYLATAAANVNALPDDASAPGGVALLPSTDGLQLFGYAKWLWSGTSTRELVGPTLSPLLNSVFVWITLIAIGATVYLVFTIVTAIVRFVAWLIQQALKFIPFMG